MTKDEIRYKNDFYITDGWVDEASVNLSMDEYAKQECLEFGEYIAMFKLYDGSKRPYKFINGQQMVSRHEPEQYTITDIYEMYLKYKKK